MRIKKFASECETMEDEFNRLFDVDASEPDPFGDDSAETTTTGSNSSHVQSELCERLICGLIVCVLSSFYFCFFFFFFCFFFFFEKEKKSICFSFNN